jgi:hypothetical protein
MCVRHDNGFACKTVLPNTLSGWENIARQVSEVLCTALNTKSAESNVLCTALNTKSAVAIVMPFTCAPTCRYNGH